MYRQILMDPRDVKYQRILWSADKSEPIRAYQLDTVTYGTASAPFLALRVVQQLTRDEGKKFPLAVPVLTENIYVDDVLFGADNVPLLRQIREQVRSLLRLGQFDLRKWSSNTAKLLQDIESSDHGVACNKNLQTDEQLKILGISWNPSRDVFQFNVSVPASMPTTKRAILSATAKIFDPLGWGTPVTINAKILLQKLWLSKSGWDDPIPSQLMNAWRITYSSVAALKNITIPRWVEFGQNTVNCELHGFADASCAAYAASVYVRVTSRDGTTVTSLLIGKSKVAPVKSWSIPRLELAAAVLLARLLEFARTTCRFETVSCFCWTDSTVVLSWLAGHPSRWKTFVANRVSDIQSRLPLVKWRHIATQDNPADCASRGISGDALLDHSLWWHGPPWINLPHSKWPVQTPIGTTNLEESSRSVHVASTQSEGWDLHSRFSSWPKLIRVTAYVFRFVTRARKADCSTSTGQSRSRALTADECHQARVFWLRYIQEANFQPELKALRNHRPLPTKSSLIALRPFLDVNQLIRVGGRLQHSTLPRERKHPIVLGGHPVVNLIVQQCHLRTLHAGPQLTIATLRHDFWILRARNIVKQIIHKCVVCAREKAEVPQQIMGELPQVRVSPPARAFIHCGLDYAGPVPVRSSPGRGHKSRKAYIAIFVCMATRAVHIELVDGYTSSAFIAAFSRFCSRRGLPTAMYSDNGTTFTGADRELRAAFRGALSDPDFQNSTAVDKITWNFIPPASPHFGGLWEAGVRSAKHHLKRVLGPHTLTFEELTTLLCNIEACLNSRPLSALTDSLDDFETLTPGHFLIGSALNAVPEPSALAIPENRLSRWQVLRQLHEQFWKAWSADYLHTLQQRVKWRKQTPPVEVGQLVLLRNSTLPPCKWELGRVIHCYIGPDGLTRVVKVKTAKSEFVRPIVKLVRLPIDVPPSDESSL